MPVWLRLADIVREHGAAALVTVHAVKGSAPREPGARMIVRPDGAFHGTIGGGRLEWDVLQAAREALAPGRGPARFLDQALGPDLGQCCGGFVRLLVETFDRRDVKRLEALARAEQAGGEIACWLDGAGRVERKFPSQCGGARESRRERGRLRLRPTSHGPSPAPVRGDPIPAQEGESWRELLAPPRTPLLLFGAGHVGRALVLALAPLPFAIRWIDSRDDAFPPHIPVNATPVRIPDPVTEFAAAPENAFILVMTHEHPLDLAITAAALRLGFPFVGLIGSSTKRARFERRFRELGLPEGRIRALACPIGLSAITGKEPAIIAASVAAQVLAERERRAALSETAPEPLEESA